MVRVTSCPCLERTVTVAGGHEVVDDLCASVAREGSCSCCIRPDRTLAKTPVMWFGRYVRGQADEYSHPVRSSGLPFDVLSRAPVSAWYGPIHSRLLGA